MVSPELLIEVARERHADLLRAAERERIATRSSPSPARRFPVRGLRALAPTVPLRREETWHGASGAAR
jgi:hypothetical protein